MKNFKLFLLGFLLVQLNYGQTVNWSYTIGSKIETQVPTIATDGTIYIGSEDNTNFHAINPDGTLKWTYTGLLDNVYSSATIGSDGTIYVGAKDDFLHAINPDGTQKWKFALGGDAIYSSPAIANDGTIYISSDSDKLFAVNPNGTQKWVFTTATFNIRSTPAIASNGTVYIASDDDKLYALNPADGTTIWSYNVGGDVEGHVALDTDGTIFVGVDKNTPNGSVFAINPNGTLKWESANTGRVLSSPVLANGFVYFGTKDTNRLFALNAATGATAWSYFTIAGAEGIILSTPAIGDDGKIYFGSFDDKLYCLNANGTLNFGINLSSPVTTFNLWSSPVIRNGNLYIGSYDGKLYSVAIPSTNLASSNWPMFGKNLKHTSSDDTTVIVTYNYYADADGDGYGTGAIVVSTSPTAPIGFSINNLDCNDANVAINPGATEIFDSIDNDCDGNIDEGVIPNIVNWSYNIGSRIETQIPTIATDGTIYIGSEDNSNFHAINSDGTLKWTYTGITDNVYSSASIGSDGTIYVGSKDDFLHAINPDGTQKWKFPIGGDAIYSSPAIANDGTIYISSDADKLFAVNPDGTQKWVFTTAGFNIRSTPGIGSNGTVYIASDDDKLYALNPVDGTTLWSYNVGGDVEGCITLDTDGTIFVGVDKNSPNGSVFAINPNGTLKWESANTGRVLSSPVLANGFVYFGTKDTNKLFALNATTGVESWSYAAGESILSTPAVGDDGKIYFGSFDDKLYFLNSDGTLNFGYVYSEGFNTWSSPVIKNGKLYIGSYDGKLYSINIPSTNLASSNWPMFGKNLLHTSSADTTTTKNYYVDADGDGYGAGTIVVSWSQTTPTGYSVNNTDCDDTRASVYPGATEIFDTIDNNCEGSIDEGTTLVAPVVANTAICKGTVGYSPSATALPGYTLVWFKDATTTTALPSAPVITATKTYYVAQRLGTGPMSSRVSVSTTVNDLPSTPGTISTTDAVLCKYIGTSNTVTYSVPAVAATSYNWTVPAGVNVIADASATDNSITVNFLGSALNNTSVGGVGTISVRSVNSLGCISAVAKSLVLTSKLPSAPASLTLTSSDTALDFNVAGVPSSLSSLSKITKVGPYMKTNTVFTLTAPSAPTAASYAWTLPSGATQLSGGTSNVITVNFAGNALGTTGSLPIVVKSVGGCGQSVDRTLTLARAIPAAPTKLVLTEGLSTTAITKVGTYTGKSTQLTLTATPILVQGATATSYAWVLPAGVVCTSAHTTGITLTGSTTIEGVPTPWTINNAIATTTGTITINFSGVASGLFSFPLSVYGVNGVGNSKARTLTVTAAAPATPSITASPATTFTSCSTRTYTATSVPGVTYNWTIPAEASIVGASNGNVIVVDYAATSVAIGASSVVTCSATNGTGTSAIKSLTVKRVDCPAKVSGTSNDDNFSVNAYPNPSSDVFNIETSGKGATAVEVYDMQGRLVENSKANTNTVQVGARLSSGAYNVIVKQGANTKTLRVIKK